MINDFFNMLLPQTCLIFFIFLQLILSIVVSPKLYKTARLISILALFTTILTLTTVQVEPQYFALKNSLMSDHYTLLFNFLIWQITISLRLAHRFSNSSTPLPPDMFFSVRQPQPARPTPPTPMCATSQRRQAHTPTMAV